MAQWQAALTSRRFAASRRWTRIVRPRPSCDGGDAGAAPQGLQIGLPDAVEGFGDDDGQDGASNPGSTDGGGPSSAT